MEETAITTTAVWQLVTYGSTVGVGLGVIFYLMGVWSGFGFRKMEQGIKD